MHIIVVQFLSHFIQNVYALGTRYSKIFGFKVPYNSLSSHTSGSSIQKGYASSALTSDKVVILTFGDGRKSQFTNARPILDKYGFKASFFIVCNWVGLSSQMSWQDIEQLHEEGHDIGSKTMSYKILTNLSSNALNYEISGSKQCLLDHRINSTIFATPQGVGWNNATVINTIAKYYKFAVNGFSSLMYLHCDGWKRISSQTDCRTYFDNGTLTYANRYSIKEWSHSSNDIAYLHDDNIIFKKFVAEVNSQNRFNKDGTISAIPILAYHNIENRYGETLGTTDLSLFDAEMKYLHDSGFRVITISDLAYNGNSKYLYIKNS
jgi:peptidoglycan/xylan/chitin deacetylase (PgdA/CDA1 family)